MLKERESVNSKIFNECLAELGGCLDIKRFSKKIILHFHKENAIKEINKFSVLQQQPPIIPHFDYVNNPLLNAVAFKDGEKYFIGLFAGTIFIVHNLFMYLLAHPLLLQNIGDPKKEIMPSQYLRSGLVDASKLIKFGSTDGSPLASHVPCDLTRKLYARTLAYIATNFLIHHELAHILFGHVDLKKVRTGSALIAEFEQEHPSDLDKIDMNTLEMDADSFAICKGVEAVLWRVKHKDSINLAWQPYFQNVEDSMHMWLLAVNLVFRLFATTSLNLHSGNHPPARIRQFYVGTTAFEYIKMKESSDLAKRILSIDANLTKEVEEVYATITCEVPEYGTIKDTLNPKTQEFMSLLLSNWKKLRPELLPYARLPLYE